MANVNVYSKSVNTNSNIGAIVCRTPITLEDSVDFHGQPIDNRCVYVDTVSKLIDYFGDPFVSPYDYPEMILVYDLVSRGIPIIISSIYEMKNNDDGFKIKYNGYTEFYFKDDNGFKSVGYKLKSRVKFCQPIIQSEYSNSILTLHVSSYLMNRSFVKRPTDLNSFYTPYFYRSFKLDFDTSTATDKNIIDSLEELGFELKVVNGYSSTSLIDEFKRFSKLAVLANDGESSSIYAYNLHNNNYSYNFSDDNVIFSEYENAILRIKDKNVEPHFLCLSKLYRSTEIIQDGNLLMANMVDLDPFSYSVIYEYILSIFDSDSNTYLIISAPDVSVSSVIDLFTNQNDFSNALEIKDQFNCDIFYGYAGDYVSSSLRYADNFRVFYSAAVLSFYNLMYNGLQYMNNSIGNLNVSCDCVKSNINESSAERLKDARCNSVVLFSTGLPSIYGNRTLSYSNNLKYSHISRNMVYIRRLIREFIATREFTINNNFNAQSTINYIRSSILESFKSSGVIQDYNIDYTIDRNSMFITIDLLFNTSIEYITLNFTL